MFRKSTGGHGLKPLERLYGWGGASGEPERTEQTSVRQGAGADKLQLQRRDRQTWPGGVLSLEPIIWPYRWVGRVPRGRERQSCRKEVDSDWDDPNHQTEEFGFERTKVSPDLLFFIIPFLCLLSACFSQLFDYNFLRRWMCLYPSRVSMTTQMQYIYKQATNVCTSGEKEKHTYY